MAGTHGKYWDWDCDLKDVSHGHCFTGNYDGAEQDFATCSGLILEQRLFRDEQLIEMIHDMPNTKRARRTDCGVPYIVFRLDRCICQNGGVKGTYSALLLTGTCISDSHWLSSSLFQTPSI